MWDSARLSWLASLPMAKAILVVVVLVWSLSFRSILCTHNLQGIVLHRLSGPLSHLPGPWHSRFTNLRLKWAVLSGQRMFYVHKLHQQYGPVVRIAPNEADICDAQGFKQIHSPGSGFRKSDWYRIFTMQPRVNCFSMSDPVEHGVRRRLLSQPFSKTSLRRDWEPTIREKVHAVVKQIVAEGRSGKPVDVRKWWNFFATDVIAHLSFGESFGQIESGDKNAYMEALHDHMAGGIVCTELPLLYAVGHWLPFASFQKIFAAAEIIQSYAQRAVDNMQVSSSYRNIFAKINETFKGETTNMDDVDVRVEAAALIIAGSDITSTALTFLTYMVLSCPELKEQLETEVATLPLNYLEADVENLGLLNAVINEILRIYNPAPSGLPRVVPSGGKEISGYLVPGGSIVTTQSYSLHRLPSAWPNPDKCVHIGLSQFFFQADSAADLILLDGSVRYRKKPELSTIHLEPVPGVVLVCISRLWRCVWL